MVERNRNRSIGSTTESSLLDKTIRLASELESSSFAATPALTTTPLTIFQVGSILHETRKSFHEKKEWYELSIAFHTFLSKLNQDYLKNVIFGDLNQAFAFVLKSSEESIRSSIQSSINVYAPSASTLLSNEVSSTVSSSISAMCGIYDALFLGQKQKQGKGGLMEYAFDVNVCNNLVLLYDSIMDALEATDYINASNNGGLDNNNAESKRSNMNELKECVLSALSSLLLH